MKTVFCAAAGAGAAAAAAVALPLLERVEEPAWARAKQEVKRRVPLPKAHVDTNWQRRHDSERSQPAGGRSSPSSFFFLPVILEMVRPMSPSGAVVATGGSM